MYILYERRNKLQLEKQRGRKIMERAKKKEGGNVLNIQYKCTKTLNSFKENTMIYRTENSFLKNYLFSFYVYKCLACMFICAPCHAW